MGSPKTAAAAPRIELPSLIAATMRSRKSPDSGAGMTSPPTHQNRLPRISIPDSAQHKSALARGGDPLSELRQQRVDTAAIALDHRGELVALRHLHTDAADIDIGDLGCAASFDDIPVDKNPAAVRASDLAGHDRFTAARAAADDAERLAAIFTEPGGIGLHDVLLEQPQELLLFLGRRDAPVASEHELPDPRHVEITLEDLAKAGDALCLRNARSQHLDRLVAERGDKTAGILGVGFFR